MDSTTLLFEVVPLLCRGSVSLIITTFYVMSPTATRANVMHLGYSILIGSSLTLSFVDPLGNDAIVKVVARRLLLACATAVHQLLLFKAVSAPLILLLLLGLAIYLARVCMASTAELEKAHQHIFVSVWQALYAVVYVGLAALLMLPVVAPKIKAWVEPRSVQVTTYQDSPLLLGGST